MAWFWWLLHIQPSNFLELEADIFSKTTITLSPSSAGQSTSNVTALKLLIRRHLLPLRLYSLWLVWRHILLTYIWKYRNFRTQSQASLQTECLLKTCQFPNLQFLASPTKKDKHKFLSHPILSLTCRHFSQNFQLTFHLLPFISAGNLR